MKINQIGRIIAIATFVAGTMLLLVFYLCRYYSWRHLETLTLLLAVVIVLAVSIAYFAVIVILLFKLTTDAQTRTTTLRTIGLMFCNLPIGLFYFYLASEIREGHRFEIINNSSKLITHIEIGGFGGQSIAKLDPSESDDFWVYDDEHNWDQNFYVTYLLDGKLISDECKGGCGDGEAIHINGKVIYYVEKSKPKNKPAEK